MIYDENSINTYYYIYKPRIIEKIAVIEADISYPHKYLDRSALESLLTKAKGYDEVLIMQNGLLSDTTIANIALRRNGQWFTPSTPLLPGTTRARLLTEGKLILQEIHYKDFNQYDGLALMNAMIGFYQTDINTVKVV